MFYWSFAFYTKESLSSPDGSGNPCLFWQDCNGKRENGWPEMPEPFASDCHRFSVIGLQLTDNRQPTTVTKSLLL